MIILLNGLDVQDDDCKRQLYVAMTRAKANLVIHYNGGFLDALVADNLTYTIDKGLYPGPPVLSCLLTHRDVQLGYFEFVQHRIGEVYSGMPLQVTAEGLATAKGLVVKFSKEFAKTIADFAEKGYVLRSAKVNFIVYWYHAKEGKEVKIVLPEVGFGV